MSFACIRLHRWRIRAVADRTKPSARHNDKGIAVLMTMNESGWRLILVLLALPVLAVGLLNVAFRKRGGIGKGWGGVVFVGLAGLVALLAILEKIRF
ncbi:hypothetical protein [Pseudomonas helleri]|uniref:Uncharacterized protein n=1 Tax=Pseudomonas helleri TaxID=1608996 RepID=A0A6L5I299_9PSED|nr:hypothetical protein [Pseudomonas helleri]MQU09650.1 hypothetical protein [Pseudomonas helleri]